MAYWRRPEAYLDPIVRANISIFHQLPAGEVATGIARLREDLASGAWAANHADLLVHDEVGSEPAKHVYDWCMARTRTNIEIDEARVLAIMERYGVRTKTAAVDLALRHLAGQPMTREEALAMRGAHAIAEAPPDVPPPTP